MAIMIFAIIAFLILLLLPVVGGLLSYKRDKVKLLHIDAHKTKDPRYFSKSFSALMEKHLVDYDGSGTIRLSKEEAIIEADKAEHLPTVCESLIYAKAKDFVPIGVESFEKEIFARENVRLEHCNHVRALCCQKDAILGEHIYVDRWIDAYGTLAIYDNCHLGISASSAIKLVIGANCEFKRLYAPVIHIGQYPEEEIPPATMKKIDPHVSTEVLHSIGYVDNTRINEDGVVNKTIITWKNLIIIEDMVVQGDIRSHRNVRLCDNAVVCGNIFAEGNVILGRNTWVMGTIFTQSDIIAEEGVVIGREGKIVSVIARGSIVFSYKTRVHGYINAESGGYICPDTVEGVGTRKEGRQLTFAPKPAARSQLRFSSLADYRNMDEEGFRNDSEIEEVEIPAGVTEVLRSWFFQCTGIKSVVLPDTLQEIGDFAFYGCARLERLDLRHCVNLHSIGASAFAKCISLKTVYLPEHLLTLESAAFCGCTNLTTVDFSGNMAMTVLRSHCFMDCGNLTQLILPQSLTEIQTSAFYGCSSLQHMTIPEKVETVGNYVFAHCEACQRVCIYHPLPLQESKGFSESIEVALLQPENKKDLGVVGHETDR